MPIQAGLVWGIINLDKWVFWLIKFLGNLSKYNVYKVTPSPIFGQRGAITVFYRCFFHITSVWIDLSLDIFVISMKVDVWFPIHFSFVAKSVQKLCHIGRGYLTTCQALSYTKPNLPVLAFTMSKGFMISQPSPEKRGVPKVRRTRKHTVCTWWSHRFVSQELAVQYNSPSILTSPSLAGISFDSIIASSDVTSSGTTSSSSSSVWSATSGSSLERIREHG